MEINEIIRLAFLKYRLSGHKSTNTFIFTQAKNNKLTDKQIDEILNTLDDKIKILEEEKKKKLELETEKEIEKVINLSFNKKVV